ncbi:MAG: metal-dependent phosphohydrolase [Spirochaetales bacterium]|jgi:response regulator RpfG family c-di-GMP phosphodiesterase|nr:metal-dependent phosphohydrolase [Spirochaetales bacterium]
MAEKISVVLLRKVLASNGRYIDFLIREAIPVVCLNKSTRKTRIVNFKALFDNNNRFWLMTSSWEYFLTSEEFAKLKDRLQKAVAVPKAAAKTPPAEAEPEAEERLVDPGFGKQYAAIAAMTPSERVEHIKESKARLDELITGKSKDHEAVTEALVDTTRDAALINRATLLEAMQSVDDEAKRRTQAIVNSTQDMVKSSTALITENVFSDELMTALVEKSNGTVIQHMTRVFLNGVAFLSYYNNLVSHSSIINKLRIGFDKKYKKYYRTLLAHIHADDITLERVFYKGMRAIREHEFLNWATGFLIHDIGKASAVEYHEGEAAYNRDIVMDHVKVGYTSVMNKTNYPRDAGLITGYHHEYYGDPAGYGYFRSYLARYKKLKPEAIYEACITYELEPMMDYQALAYFPAKVLEIIDVYDSVTDPNRKYRKALTPEEALGMLQEEFIEKHFKIDVILYDLFADFVRQRIVKK